MIRGNLLMGLRPMAPPGDRFDPDHVVSRPGFVGGYDALVSGMIIV
jgi:hypothetical protein